MKKIMLLVCLTTMFIGMLSISANALMPSTHNKTNTLTHSYMPHPKCDYGSMIQIYSSYNIHNELLAYLNELINIAVSRSIEEFNTMSDDELLNFFARTPILTQERVDFWDMVWDEYKHTFIGVRHIDDVLAFSDYMNGTSNRTLCDILGFSSPHCLHCN